MSKSIILSPTIWQFVLIWIMCTVRLSVFARNITIVGDDFMLDGKRLRIHSGSVHYFQVPKQYWRDRLLKLKSAGLNAVSTYVEWRYHELQDREYQFDGNRDVVKFINVAAELGLYVLLRPGPYIDAERDMGGLPYWLLAKYPNINLRTSDKDYIAETTTWMAKLFEKLTPLLYGNGGPIILIENEYAFFYCDKRYREEMHSILHKHVDNKALFYTTDSLGGNHGLECGAVQGALTTIDFPIDGDVKASFDTLRNFVKSGPLMDSELYAGWATHWGEPFRTVPIETIIKNLRYILQKGYSFNLYMFHSGTHFGLDSTANIVHRYDPLMTSYDFDAPLNEAGDVTPIFEAIRKLMIEFYPEVKNITPPNPSPKEAYGNVVLRQKFDLLSVEGRVALGKKYSDVVGATLPTFEKLGQPAGLMLYETILTKGGSNLNIQKPRDRIYAFVDGLYTGLIDRQQGSYDLDMGSSKPNARLSLLVENQGRNCFGGGNLRDVKEMNATSYLFNQEKVTEVKFGPVLYEGTFELSDKQEPMDTFLDTRGWSKGYAWVNGYGLGRYWGSRGPQLTLYVPGVWLRRGNNTLRILELELPPLNFTASFLNYPNIK